MARVLSGRFTPPDITAGLDLLAELAGTWKGHGFNLIARPDFHDKTDLYLQLNHTRETLNLTRLVLRFRIAVSVRMTSSCLA